MQNLGVVIIGRNEGERLKRCLSSLGDLPRVYVDSGSSDGSVAYAQSVGAWVVALDISQPFTAARARNAGFNALMARHPSLEWVMFVDGDCEINESWFANALPHFTLGSQFALGAQRPDERPADKAVAVVCGRRRERFPKQTLYNFLCDIEWNTPVGEATACGGDAIYRVTVLREVGGFNDRFIAGEEPELCFRIRQKGYRILRIDAEMTLHDAAITRFSQWWKRSKRSGYAYFLNAYTHGSETSEQFCRREVKSILAWGGLFYGCIVVAIVVINPMPLVAYCGLIGLQVLRLGRKLKRIISNYGSVAAYQYGFMVMLGKIPELHGIVSGLTKVILKKEHTLVEYK